MMIGKRVRFSESNEESEAKEKEKEKEKGIAIENKNVSIVNGINVEILCYIPSLSEITNDEKRTIWYNKKDLDKTIRVARACCMHSRKNIQINNHLSKAFENSHSYALSLDEPDIQNGETEFSEEEKYTSKAISLIKKWNSYEKTCRGLETWSSLMHEEQREEEQQNYYYHVFTIQEKLKEKRQNGILTDEDYDTVSQIAKDYSLLSTHFAFCLAIVDAMEVDEKKEHDYEESHHNQVGLVKKLTRVIHNVNRLFSKNKQKKGQTSNKNMNDFNSIKDSMNIKRSDI